MAYSDIAPLDWVGQHYAQRGLPVIEFSGRPGLSNPFHLGNGLEKQSAKRPLQTTKVKLGILMMKRVDFVGPVKAIVKDIRTIFTTSLGLMLETFLIMKPPKIPTGRVIFLGIGRMLMRAYLLVRLTILMLSMVALSIRLVE